jgi:hypothetical protein
MKLPSITKFLDIKDPRDSLGSPKVDKIDRENLPPKEVYMSWEQTLSVDSKKVINQRYYRPLLIIGIFVGLLLLIMQEFFVILIIGSVIFFVQAVMKMSPENVKYELNNHGVLIGDHLYYWDTLVRYYFIFRESVEVLAVDTTLGFPGRIYISFNPSDKEKIKEIMEKYLHYLESEPKTFLDNAYDRVAKKFGTDEAEDTDSLEDDKKSVPTEEDTSESDK